MKAIWPRDVPHCRNIFFRNHHWGAHVDILGGQSWATTALPGTKTVTMKLTKKAAVKLFDNTPIKYYFAGPQPGGEFPQENFSLLCKNVLDIVQKICAPLRKLLAPPGVPSCLRD